MCNERYSHVGSLIKAIMLSSTAAHKTSNGEGQIPRSPIEIQTFKFTLMDTARPSTPFGSGRNGEHVTPKNSQWLTAVCDSSCRHRLLNFYSTSYKHWAWHKDTDHWTPFHKYINIQTYVDRTWARAEHGSFHTSSALTMMSTRSSTHCLYSCKNDGTFNGLTMLLDAIQCGSQTERMLSRLCEKALGVCLFVFVSRRWDSLDYYGLVVDTIVDVPSKAAHDHHSSVSKIM